VSAASRAPGPRYPRLKTALVVIAAIIAFPVTIALMVAAVSAGRR
jgi:hypothetical protein